MKKIYNSPELEIVKFTVTEPIASDDIFSQNGDWNVTVFPEGTEEPEE